MTGKAILAAFAAGAICAGNFSAAGLGVAAKNIDAADVQTDGYYFGVIDVPYADFYYGEINHVQPEADAEAGQYDTADVVTEEGYREEGIYDAVTSATNAKSKKFEQSYFEEQEDGTVQIFGVSGVNVAISKALYDDVQKAIEDGTECSNPLIDFVSAMGEVSEEVPAEYKVINSDGTLSETIGTETVLEDAKVSFSSAGTWGHYQIGIEGLELDAMQIQGALIETDDGTIYGLEHLDNLWLQAKEVAFAVEEMTEPHGNTPSYNRFADIQGKTITKLTYMVANADDVVIEMEAYVKPLLPEEYSITLESSVVYTSEGTQIPAAFEVPEGCEYVVSSVLAGRSAIGDDSLYSMEDGVVTFSPELKPGQYTVVFSDEEYADQKVGCLVDSGLEEGSVTIEDNKIVVAENEAGLTAADYVSAIGTVKINGEPVQGRGVASIIFAEDGTINLDAAIDNNGESVPVFDGSDSYEIEVEATAYPAAKGTVTP